MQQSWYTQQAGAFVWPQPLDPASSLDSVTPLPSPQLPAPIPTAAAHVPQKTTATSRTMPPPPSQQWQQWQRQREAVKAPSPWTSIASPELPLLGASPFDADGCSPPPSSKLVRAAN